MLQIFFILFCLFFRTAFLEHTLQISLFSYLKTGEICTVTRESKH